MANIFNGRHTIFICVRNNVLARGRIASTVMQLHRRHDGSDDDDEDEISRLARTPTAPQENHPTNMDSQ